MSSNNLVELGIFLEVVSAFIFFVALIVVIFSKEYRNKALIVMIICVITCVIGFGLCFSNFSLGGHM